MPVAAELILKDELYCKRTVDIYPRVLTKIIISWSKSVTFDKRT